MSRKHGRGDDSPVVFGATTVGARRVNENAPRDLTFDFVKGGLVVMMVAYHAMSIASTAGVEQFRYIRFVSGSFIFVSGYIIARFTRSAFSRTPGPTTRRLITRGVKMLLIFSALNFLIQASGIGNAEKTQVGVAGFFVRAKEIYLTGDGSIASFVILLPIAYLLLIAPVLLLLLARGGRIWGGLILLVAVLLASTPLTYEGSAVAEFMLVGVIGMCAGQLVPSVRFIAARGFVRHVLAWGSLTICVWITGHLGSTVAAYTVGVALVLAALFEVGEAVDSRGFLARFITLLGRYSLLGYIGQIVVIQMLFRVFGHGQRWPVGTELAWLGLATIGILLTTVAVLERLRQRSATIDRAYRLVFT